MIYIKVPGSIVSNDTTGFILSDSENSEKLIRLLEVYLPYKNLHVCVIVGWSVGLLGPSHSVGQSVCHTFLNRHKVTLQWSYRSTCYKMMTLYIENKTKDNKEDASSITIITTLNTDGFCYSV